MINYRAGLKHLGTQHAAPFPKRTLQNYLKIPHITPIF